MTSSSYLTELVLLLRNHADQDCTHHATIVVCLCHGVIIFASHKRDPIIFLMLEDGGNIGGLDLPVLLHLIDIHLPIGMKIDLVA